MKTDQKRFCNFNDTKHIYTSQEAQKSKKEQIIILQAKTTKNTATSDCDWCRPVRSLYPLCSCRRSSPYCYYYCCFCLCYVGTSSFYLYRLSCPILAAAVLLLYYAGDAAETLLFSHHFFPWTPPPPRFLPGSPTFPFRSAKLRLFRHSYTCVILRLRVLLGVDI